MKRFSAFLGLFLLVTAAIDANAAGNMIQARSTYHQDGSRTETIVDPETKTKTETTYSANGVVVSRHQYLLNDQGQVTQGNIYDGAGNLVARSISDFDSYGRVKGSRLFNLQGECFQQTVYEYTADNKPKRPKVINYNVKAPSMKPAIIDFTGTTAPPPSATGGATQGRPAATPTTPQPEQPKKSFFKRLFDKKEKK